MANRDRAVILIGSSVRAAAVDAKRGGYRVTAIDRFGDRDLLASCDTWIPYDHQQHWLHRLHELPPDPLVPLGGFHEDCQVADRLAMARGAGGRLVAYPSPKVCEKLNSPAWLGEIASSLGVFFPETRQWCEDNLVSLFRPTLDSPLQTAQWLAKPVIHGGGIAISVVEEHSLLPPTMHLQQRLRGSPLGASLIAYPAAGQRRALLLGIFRGITHRRNPDHRFLYGGSMGPVEVCAAVRGAIESLGQAIADQATLAGLFNLDFMLGKNGELALLEVNPRYSASMELIPITHGQPQSLIDWHLACYQHRSGVANPIAALGQNMKRHPPNKFACKRILYAKTAMMPTDPLQGDEVRRDEAESDEFGRDQRGEVVSSLDVQYCDLPPAKTAFAAGDPICTAIVSGSVDHRKDIVSAAYRGLSRFNWKS